MWLLYGAVGVHILYSIFILFNALERHNRTVNFNAIPVVVISIQQLLLIPLMIKYF